MSDSVPTGMPSTQLPPSSGGTTSVATWTDKLGPGGTFQIWASTLQVEAPALEPVTAPVPTLTDTPLAQAQGTQPPSTPVGGAARTAFAPPIGTWSEPQMLSEGLLD